MNILWSCVFFAFIFGGLCSCAGQRTSEFKSKKLSYMPTSPVILKNDSNERKILRTSRSLTEAKDQAVRLGVIPFEQKTFPQLENSITNGSPVIIESDEGLLLIIGHDPDKRSFIRRQGKKLRSVNYATLQELFTKGGRKAAIFSEPWEVTQESDLENAFQFGLKMSKSSPKKARKVFEKLIEIAPDAPGPYLALANTYQSSESAKAVDVLEKGVARNPNEFALWYNLAAYQALNGQNWRSRQTAWKTQAMFRPADVPSRLRGRLSLLGSN